jgi:hypothetical protein
MSLVALRERLPLNFSRSISVCGNVGQKYAGHHYDMQVIVYLIPLGIASIGRVIGGRLVNCRYNNILDLNELYLDECDHITCDAYHRGMSSFKQRDENLRKPL